MTIQYKEYELLKKALRRDYWDEIEICYFLLGCVRLSERGLGDELYNLISGEEIKKDTLRRNRYNKLDADFHDLLKTWRQADHDYRYRKKNSWLWDKYYCLHWGQTNSISDEFQECFKWGLGKGLINQEDLDNILDAESIEKDSVGKVPLKNKERENRLRLIGVMLDILTDKATKKKFTSESQLKEYIRENYAGEGLSQRLLADIFKDAKSLVDKKK